MRWGWRISPSPRGCGQGEGATRAMLIRPSLTRPSGTLPRWGRGVGLTCLALLAGCVQAGEAVQILQTSPVAGFQHHAGPALFSLMQVGDVLTLSREPDNPHDGRAVRVLWHGAQIGYAPRLENVDLARFMDQGVPLQARILHLQTSRDPWKRVLMEIVILDEATKP